MTATGTNGGTLRFTYDTNGHPMTVTQGAVTYCYVTNLQGDVIAILNSTNNTPVVEYTYNAWGQVMSVTGSMANTLGLRNPLRYRGYVYDAETSLYYLQSRYYDPETGRFLNADTVDQLGITGDPTSFNIFAYSGNNPVGRKDSCGYYWESALDIAAIGLDVVELSANPSNLIAWGALAADLAGLLLPGVTGGGGVVRFVASADNLADAVKYADNVVDSAKAIHSNWDIGKTMHKAYTPIDNSPTSYINKALSTIFEGVDSKLRPDAVDTAQNIIYELKPYNKSSFIKAINQTLNYLQKMGNPKNWTVVIDMYY